MELSGRWRAHPADDDLRRAFHDDEFDDTSWPFVDVPGHWRSGPLADADGPVLYRRTFTHPGPARPDGRLWLRFEGVFSQGDVWLDGSYAGDTEGYFVPHAFEVTDQLAARRDHALAVEVGCPSVEDSEPKRALTGAYQDSAHLAPGANPGGIWRPVRIVETGPVSIRHGRVVCRDATEERATLGLRLVLDSPDARPVRIRTQVAGVHHELEQPLAAGENRVEWTVTVNNPVRWWPHTLGPSPLHDVRVDVCIEDEDDQLAISDSRTWRTGFRSIELRNWICRVNGERLFLKGANLSPLGPYPADATPSELRAWVREARDAGLDLLRVHTHIAPPELYRAADELGMLLWQDLPMHGRYARTVRREAVRQAREAVDLLGHHPSVALWCAHDEPYAIDRRERRRAISPGLLPQQLPTWNRSILDRSVKRVLAKSDGSRPVIAHSGVLPHLPRLDGTDAHVWFGWYGGVVEDLASFASTLPRQVRFVSAFGAQALPDPRPELRAPDGRPDWEALAALGIEVEVMQRVLGLPPESSLDDWVAESHAHQAMVVRRTIETLRRLKYRPTGGFSVHRLADPQGRAGFGLLDSAGRPKPAWASFVAATQPVIVVADPPPATIAPGATVELAVHVVSDERVDRPDSEVTAEVTTPAWQRSWRWKGDVHADACVLVGRVRFTAPVTAGPVTLDLRVNAGEVVAVNRYVSRIG